MILVELEDSLKNNRVPKHAYSLIGGLPNEAFCIENAADGKWYTYYSQHGNRSSLKEIQSEEEACNYFYNDLKSDIDLGPFLNSD